MPITTQAVYVKVFLKSIEYTLKGIFKMMSYIVERKALKGLSVSWQTVRVVRVILLLSTSQQIFKE